VKPLLSYRARSVRFKAIQSLVEGDVLDVGCGYTTLPDVLTGFTSYMGVDVSEAAVAYCQRKYPQHKFMCLNLDIDVMPDFEQQFDTVTMIAVIEHLHRPDRALRAVRPLLKDGGRLLITTPSPLGDMAHQIGSRIGLFYPESVVQHVKIFTKGELCRLVVECGFEIERYRRFLFGLNHFVACRPTR